MSERIRTNTVYIRTTAHREAFEIEDVGGGVCRCTAIFDQYAADSPTLGFQDQGSLEMCGSSLKSLLESGRPLEFMQKV